MGKGKRSREPGTKRRTILQIDSNKISRSNNVSVPKPEEEPAVQEPVDDQLAEFLKEISALEQENAKSAIEQENAQKLACEGNILPNDSSTQQNTPAPCSSNDTPVSDVVLPQGWEKVLDATSGYHYYWNVLTNETKWEPPPVKIPVTTSASIANQISEFTIQNPVGLSLISTAYSESDSETNSPTHVIKEGAKNRENTDNLELLQQTDTNAILQSEDATSNTTNTMEKEEVNQLTNYKRSQKTNKSDSDSSSAESHKPKTKRFRKTTKQVFTQTEMEETVAKPTEDALRPLIQQLATEMRHKQEFLGISLQQVNQLQAMLVEVETRVQDWRAGYLPSEYTLTRLRESARILSEYEQSAAPVGWGCSWNASLQKYQYVQESSGRVLWEYPTAPEPLADDDMVLSGGESDEYPPLPLLPPSPTSGPPLPPSGLITNEARTPLATAQHKSDLESTKPPLPNSSHSTPVQTANPPLPDPPESGAPSLPPPLPVTMETLPSSDLPPLPPNSSPSPPPCSDTATPPLPPSEDSDMSRSPASLSPSTNPNSPYPPSELETSVAATHNPSQQQIYGVTSQHNAQYYIQPERQQQLVYAYYPAPSGNYDAHNQAAYLQQQYPPVVEPAKSPPPSGKSRGKKTGSKKAPPASTLATHAVSHRKKGMASMLEKWQQMHSVEPSSDESESEADVEGSLKDRIDEWKKEQLVSGKAQENANFQNIHGNWKDKIKRAKQTSAHSLLNPIKQTEG